MTLGVFESIYAPAITGTLKVDVLDPNGVEPVSIIQIGDDWTLNVEWELKGQGLPMFHGEWNLVAYLESIGPGFEDKIKEDKSQTIDGITTKWAVPYNITPADYPNEAGLYKLVVVLTCVSDSGMPGPFAAYTDGPVVQFYPNPA